MVKEANVSFGQGTAPKRGVTAGEVELMIAEAQANVEGDLSKVKADLEGGVSGVVAQLEETAALLKSKYKLKGDGTDTVAFIQSILDDLNSIGYKKILFPPNLSFNLATSLIIPENLKIDFNGALITTPQSINQSPIRLKGSTKIKNLKLIQTNPNGAPSGVDGIDYNEAKNVDNIFFHNVEIEGFENGINIYPQNGYLATNVQFWNCQTNHAEMAGTNVANAQDVYVFNHHAKYNGLDGFKTTRNVRDIRFQGGNFSYNVDPVSTYADGIDLYGGGNDVIISGAVCESNGGVGIHILSGELQDVNYTNPVWEPIKNIIVDSCISRNNIGAGYDIVTKLTVSPTSPYPSKVKFIGCNSYNNEYGINVRARHVSFSDCSFVSNKNHGMNLTESIYVTIDNCDIIKNSISTPGVYAGIKMTGCKHVAINGGINDGSDSDTIQNVDGSTLTIYHLYGIWLDNCDHIFIDVPSIVNFTSGRGVYVNGFNLPENANKLIVVKLGDIGTKPLNNQIGYIGSSLYKSGIRYVKRTNLNSVVWETELRTVYGSQNVTSDGVATTFTIAHGLGVVPVRYNVIPKTSNASGSRFITVDATNITIAYTTAPPSGTMGFQWEASA